MLTPHAYDIPRKEGFKSSSEAGSWVSTVAAPASPASLCPLPPTPAAAPSDGLAGKGLFREEGTPQPCVNRDEVKPLPK